MTDYLSNEEREALIAGDRAGELEPDEAADVAFLAALLADPSTWAEPSTDLEASVLRAVADAELSSDSAETSASVTSIASGTPRSTRRRSSPSRRRVVWSVVAAAAAVLIALGVVTVVRRDTNTDFQARLTATALAPGASGTVDVTHNRAGFRVDLDARGLPPLRNGDFYQAWLKNSAGTLVPIGSFSSSDANVTLWSGVSPADYPGISVTIEPADNDQRSSGRRVLVGTLRAS
jgi:hypothetical protein